MWPYWLLFLVPAFAATQEVSRRLSVQTVRTTNRLSDEWRLVLVGLIFIIGWRHEVGGDWFNYLEHYYSALSESRFKEWWFNDPGYRLLLWLTVSNGWSVHAVNLMGAVFFSYGLIKFCNSLPRPWLALAVSVPYVVIILGMGYSRQGFALGCIMSGLVMLGQGRVLAFVIWALIGATFHKSALLILPLAALASSRRRLLSLIWVGVVGFLSYGILLQDSVENLQKNYLDAQYQSEGALIRLLMNALPALLFLWNRKKFAFSFAQERLWFWFAVISLALFGVYFVSPSSTAVDRVGLYVLPIQLMVFAYLPDVLGRNPGQRSDLVILVLLYYAAVQFVWLNFASNAFAWIPYKFYPLESVF